MTNKEAVARIKDHKAIHKMNEPRAIYISEALDMAIEALENQKTGHWIADVDKWCDVVTTVNGYKCSECGKFNTDKDNYCPNCGAKMKGD